MLAYIRVCHMLATLMLYPKWASLRGIATCGPLLGCVTCWPTLGMYMWAYLCICHMWAYLNVLPSELPKSLCHMWSSLRVSVTCRPSVRGVCSMEACIKACASCRPPSGQTYSFPHEAYVSGTHRLHSWSASHAGGLPQGGLYHGACDRPAVWIEVLGLEFIWRGSLVPVDCHPLATDVE